MQKLSGSQCGAKAIVRASAGAESAVNLTRVVRGRAKGDNVFYTICEQQGRFS